MSNPAETYEQEMVPTLFGPLAELVVARARPLPGERMLDVACGTGIVARRVAALVGPTGKVVGLDLSPAMLEVARNVATQEGHSIEWHEGRAEALPFPDGAFDLVVCQTSLQFVPDRPAAVAEMRRVACTGGRVVIEVPQPLEQHPFDEQLNAIMERRFGVGPWRQAFSMGESDELRSLMVAAGLREVVIEPVTFATRYGDPERFLFVRVMTAVAAVPSLQQLAPEERQAMVTELRGEVMPLLQDYIEADEVVIPHHVHIARAVK